MKLSKNFRRHAGHRQWIRGHPCLACGGMYPWIVAAHVDYAGTRYEKKAMGQKVPDWYTVPLCDTCHKHQHAIGWKAFEETMLKRSAEAYATMLADLSPHASELRSQREKLLKGNRS